MPEFKKNNRFSGGNRSFNKGGASRPSFGAPRSGGRDFGGQKQMYDAECSSCHKMCQVPFRPNGMKPVYCSDCFDRDADHAPKGRFEKRDFSGPRAHTAPAPQVPDRRIDDIKRQLDAMNETLAKLVKGIETSNRAAALTQEVHKHIPSQTSETKAPAKGAVKKSAKKVAKKAAKKK